MSEEEINIEPPKNHMREILTYLVIAVAAFGAGFLVESTQATRTGEALKLAHEQEVKQLNEKSEQEKRALTDTLEKEREEHAKDNQTKDQHLATYASHSTGLRHTLETDLSAARASGQACTSRIAGISEAINGVFDSIGEVTGLAQDIGRENQQLKEDNRSLSEKLAGWQKWNAERMQRIIVTGKKE